LAPGRRNRLRRAPESPSRSAAPEHRTGSVPLSFVRLGARGALIGLVPALLAAQDRATGVVTGRVTARADTGAAAPAQGATASVLRTSLGATTDADGRFLLERVPVGSLTLRVRLLGYRSAEQAIRVRAGDTLRVEVTLQPEAQLLAPVRTNAQPTDVEMFLSKPNVGTVAMGKSAMAGVPSVGEPDVVRVVQLLPGVVARNDFNTGLNVRGGEADQNLILLDGLPIYNPFHFGGLFSTFMDATVGSIELMTAAFPARYGGRLSSVLDVRSAEETRTGVHATADVSALGATGRLAGTFNGGLGTWSLAGRRTYADAVMTVFTNNAFPYHFRDFHGHATYAFPGNVRLAVTGYAGRDVLDANLAEIESDSTPGGAGEGQWAFDWGNRVLGVSISKDVGRATLEQRVSASGFSTVLDLGDGAFSQRNTIRDLRLGGSLLARGTTHDRMIGYDLATHRIRYASGSPQTGTTAFDLVQRPMSAAVWVDDLWRLSSRWLVEGGLRAEGLTGRDWAALSPRVSLKYFATPRLALTAAAGRVTQWQHSLAGDGPMRYFEVWIASDSFIPVATAWHWVAGAERRVGDAGSVRLEGYYKRYERVMEANWSEDPQRRGDEFFAAEGRSYGLDLLARWQPMTGVAGWITYSYGVSSRWRDSLRWAPGHDRRHDLDVVATWRLAKYRLGARFGFATGTPYTPIVGEIARRVYDPSRDHWGTGDPRIFTESLGGPRNGARFPPTQRLDLDASREFHVRGATVTPYVSVVNAYNAKNVFIYLYEYSTDLPTRRAISQFPILPSLGVRVGF
jgi:carboxypeptidase family protein/TonB-dependent receptor-like protein